MKLAVKLPLGIAVALSLLLSAALYGLYRLNQAIAIYQIQVAASSNQSIEASEVASTFKTQIQEWKNTLIRGADPKALEKHWGAFANQESKIATAVNKLLAVMPEGESKTLVQRFGQSHIKMGESYRKAFDVFKESQFNMAVGDKAVHGMDREPSQLLSQAVTRLHTDSLKTAADAETHARYANKVSLVGMMLVFVACIVFAFLLSRSIIHQLGGEPTLAVELAQKVASGNLHTRVDLRSGDTTSLMAQLQAMQMSLTQVVARVRQGSESVANAAEEIAQGNQDLSNRTEKQASALEETSASMEQLNATFKNNADSAQQAGELAHSASVVAVAGGNLVGQVVDTMKGINESSRKISDIIQVIDGIAFQTNILALNAAVEAARAGEQGRGFAVVASEVRSLAGRSADAAKEIKTLINTSVGRVEQGSALVDKAGATMTEVVDAIHRVNNLMVSIASASKEQVIGVTQIGEAVGHMDQVTQQNSALVEEMAAAASGLRSQAQELVQTVSIFQLGDSVNAPHHIHPVPLAVRTRPT